MEPAGKGMGDPTGDALLGLPFDLYTRSKVAADFINSLSGVYGRLKVLDVGGRNGQLSKFLNEAIEVYVLDIRGPESDWDSVAVREGKYVVGDILHAPFGECHFDVVVSLDMLEHLGVEERLQAVKEMLFLSRMGVVIGAPFDSRLTDAAERRLNDYFRELTGADHPWLKEHIDARPLPSRQGIEDFLTRRGVNFSVLPNNNMELWTLMQYAIFTAVGGEKLGIDLEPVFRFYNANYETLGDGIEPVYRYIYFMAKEEGYARFLPRKPSGNDAVQKTQGLVQLADVVFRAIASGMASPLESKEAHIGNLEAVLAAKEQQVGELQLRAEQKDKAIADLNFQLLALQRTIGWKVLERLRQVRDRLLPPDTRPQAYWAFRRAAEVLLEEGLVACLRKTGYKVGRALKGHGIAVKPLPQEGQRDPEVDPNSQYRVWLQRHELTAQKITEINEAVATFTYTPIISILTPVYNTDERWLRKTIESVRAQTYPHWELCLVNDASNKPHVKPILDEYAAIDARVKVEHLPGNEGIVGASNHALSLATGEFVGLLDHDDELSPDALFEVVKRLNENPGLDLLYSDEDKLDPDGNRVEPFFKPDWSPDLLLSMNYITHFSVFRRRILVGIGGFRIGFDGSQDYDLTLRFTEGSDRIAHIPKVLYHWRKIDGSAAASVAAKPFAYKAGQRALEDALRRRGSEGSVDSSGPGRYVVRYRLQGSPLVSLIIPTRDRWQLLQQCVHSVEERTSYPRYEIIVLDNDSSEPETLNYLESLSRKWCVYRCPGPFNFAAINNFGAARAKGDYLLFVNNDTQVIRPDWLTAMLEQAQRPEVGAVGGKLLYPDGRIQHAGIVLGVGGVAGHAFKHVPDDTRCYFDFAHVVRDCSGVTAACMMVRRQLFEEVGGFDERFKVAFNDVDFCLRIRQRGYLIVCTPLALLYHHESATRGRLHPPEDEELCWRLWGEVIKAGDPYYNPNLTLAREDWSLNV